MRSSPMQYSPESAFRFKFQWVNESGNATGFTAKKGHFDGENLVLDETEIPDIIIGHLELFGTRLVFTVLGEDDEPILLAVEIRGKKIAEKLKSILDINRSTRWAELHKEQLEKEGRAQDYRTKICQCCDATLILTDMPTTAQCYCHFCDTLVTIQTASSGQGEETKLLDEELLDEEEELQICTECGFFSKSQHFTTFYFWFLLVVYGWQHGSRYCCPACMRPNAWKMFFGNLIFILGVPNAIIQLSRAYSGNKSHHAFAGLDQANILASRGDLTEAIGIYRDILREVPYSAGLKYNIGIALKQQNDTARAVQAFSGALNDCSNYVPAYHALHECYLELGETEKLQELQRIWGTEEENVPESEAMAIEEFDDE